MTRPKTQTAKLPVPVTPPKLPARPPAKSQPRKPPKPPATPIGPVAAMVRGIIERIGDMARAIGPYEAFVTVMTITGMVGLHYATDPWPIVSLVGFGVTAPLIARFTRRGP
jgi:hypothetical protein